MTETRRGSTPTKMTDPPDHHDEDSQRCSHATTVSAPEPAVATVSWDRLPLVLDASWVARLMSCSMNTLYELCRRGELPAKRIGRQWRFGRESLRRYIEGGAA